MLTADQHDEFRTTGLLRLSGAFPPAAAEAMSERLWEFLAAKYAIAREERSTWSVEHPAGFQSVTHSGAFRTVGAEQFCAALDDMFGAGQWSRSRWWARPLVTFPGKGPWRLPTSAWHVDYAPGWSEQLPAQFFAFVNEVRPRGGGTLVLTGSHHLLAPYLSDGEEFSIARVRASLGAHPWLGGLWERGTGGDGNDEDRIQRYMNAGTVIDGIPLRVVELTGEPGDVILMRSDCFHASAPNRLDQPRMMLTGVVGPDIGEK